MSHKIIILIAGHKQGGKNTLANNIAADFLNHTMVRFGGYLYKVNAAGDLIVEEEEYGSQTLSIETGIADESTIMAFGIRSMAFATPLKQFCINVLGLTQEQCYGSDKEKDSYTTLDWQDQPFWTRVKYARSWATHKAIHWPFKLFYPRLGSMTAREVMQVFGTDMIRRMLPLAWVDAGLRMAVSVPEKVVLITDCRFENEVTAADHIAPPLGTSYKVRVMRDPHAGKPGRHVSETAIDLVPLHKFDVVIPDNCSADEAFAYIRPHLHHWYEEAGIFPRSSS